MGVHFHILFVRYICIMQFLDFGCSAVLLIYIYIYYVKMFRYFHVLPLKVRMFRPTTHYFFIFRFHSRQFFSLKVNLAGLPCSARNRFFDCNDLFVDFSWFLVDKNDINRNNKYKFMGCTIDLPNFSPTTAIWPAVRRMSGFFYSVSYN